MSIEQVMRAELDYAEERDSGTRFLLDFEGNPNQDVPADSAALANLAAAIHQCAHQLSPAQLEAAVSWLKTWKINRTLPPRRDFAEYSNALDRLRNTLEQKELQSRARRMMLVSKLLTVLLGVCAVGVWVLFDAQTWRWYEMTAAAVVLLGIFIAVTTFDTRALVIAKEQDRKYFLSCLREAQSDDELLRAGLYAYFDNPLKRSAEALGRLARDRVHEQLSDALYRKPE